MNTQLLHPTTEGIREAARLLRDGQLVAVPTETVYGLAADALNPTAVASIFTAKGRPMDNPLIVHIADIKDWAPLVKKIPDNARRLAEAYWPGPLTIILPAADCVPNEVRGGLSTVAVRFPSDPVAQAVILHSGCPLAAPSANRSGSPSPTNAARVMEDMQGRIAAVLDGGDSAVGVESTVISLCDDTPRLLRPGGITPAMLEDVLGPIDIDPAVTHALEQGQTAASPGMKYKHYAPNAHIRLVKGSADSYIRYVNTHADDGVAALCFTEDAPFLNVPTVCYGHRNNPLEQAHTLFDALRQLDELGATTVYAASPNPQGVGLAVYNRLIRAAGFDIIHVPHIIGLTGPTGSGKSTVASIWQDAGIPIIDADFVARQVVTPPSACLEALVMTFSAAILHTDGTLNRQELAARAFKNPEATAALNAITHPAILKAIDDEIARLANDGHTLLVLDAPTLFEANADTRCHSIVAVLAHEDNRRSRIIARDALDDDAADRRMAAQQENTFYARNGVTVLYNNDTLDSLREQAITFLRNEKRRCSL